MDSFTVLGDNMADEALRENLEKWVEDVGEAWERVLILPPDATRSHSKAGVITRILYQLLAPSCHVDVMPALGTHEPMEEDALRRMFGEEIPMDRFKVHRWREDVVQIGTVPEEFVEEVSGGIVSHPIEVEVNERLLDASYDRVLSVGQVVPHEVVGMANYTKNVVVGCGGSRIIDKSHFLGAAWGMEKLMGRDFSPVRQVLDYAEEHFLDDLPISYLLTVTTFKEERTSLHGLFIGHDRDTFERAVRLSQEKNIELLEEPVDRVVVYLDPDEYRSTWLGNKAVYRTRMALADGGELLVLAPGVDKFGEDERIDELIRSYGYSGTERILEAVENNEELRENRSAAAHLIHGSSEGRFRITYAPGGLTKEEIEGVGYAYASVEEMLDRYDPEELDEGHTTTPDGENLFFVRNPGVGLWAVEDRFDGDTS